MQTTYADGAVTTIEYNEAGRVAARIDQRGHRASTTDALGNQTFFTYYANGNTNHWTYDHLGRILTHSLSMGHTESYTYDANGNQLTHTDFNDDTTLYDYDTCQGRLETKTYADGTTVKYTSTATGKTAPVTDSRGVTENT